MRIKVVNISNCEGDELFGVCLAEGNDMVLRAMAQAFKQNKAWSLGSNSQNYRYIKVYDCELNGKVIHQSHIDPSKIQGHPNYDLYMAGQFQPTISEVLGS